MIVVVDDEIEEVEEDEDKAEEVDEEVDEDEDEEETDKVGDDEVDEETKGFEEAIVVEATEEGEALDILGMFEVGRISAEALELTKLKIAAGPRD